MTKRPFYNTLYFRVIVGILIGVAIGFFFPDVGQALKPLGDAFIKLIKMLIAPIIFCTVVVGIAKMGDLKEVGRVGIKALVYFEVMTTVALRHRPRRGQPSAARRRHERRSGHARHQGDRQLRDRGEDPDRPSSSCCNIIPDTVVDAFAKGEILQVLLFAMLFGIALNWRRRARRADRCGCSTNSRTSSSRIVAMVMQLAPIGAVAAPWPSPSASTGSVRCCRWAS